MAPKTSNVFSMPILFLTKIKRIFAKNCLEGQKLLILGEEGCLFRGLFYWSEHLPRKIIEKLRKTVLIHYLADSYVT